MPAPPVRDEPVDLVVGLDSGRRRIGRIFRKRVDDLLEGVGQEVVVPAQSDHRRSATGMDHRRLVDGAAGSVPRQRERGAVAEELRLSPLFHLHLKSFV